ncbi:MAG: hypothetical protein C0415_00045 [Thermodesulfovibrio sp.]|nr:hypothetical protein [Thermodesulfovibrio sp.]
MKRTNIMLTEEQHKSLSAYAKKEKKTLGELVRQALNIKYKKRDVIEHRRLIAVEAYKEGFISIGKLSEILGTDTVSIRLYLKEHGILINTQGIDEIRKDIANA